MAKKKSPKGSRPHERRAQCPPQMSSAPHQPRNSNDPDSIRQSVLNRWGAGEPPRRDWRHKWRGREWNDLPPDLFPEAQGGGSGKWLLWILIPVVSFVFIYIGANVGSERVARGEISPDTPPHYALCTGLDMAMAAGFGFETQFARAQCQDWKLKKTAAPDTNPKQEEKP